MPFMPRIGLSPYTAAFIAAAFPLAAGGEETGRPSLSLPVACEIGRTCFVQNYTDIDPGPGVLDWACGTSTYDGHKGTDFRLLSAADSGRGVDVVAAAGGVVKGVRNDMEDRFAIGDVRDAIKGRECGNGLVIDHGGGWETQYCHMLKGSVAVSPGQRLERGERLGSIGFSGLVEFAHLHLSVRHEGNVIDPFLGRTPDAACATSPDPTGWLWEPQAAKSLVYATSQIIDIRFAGAPADLKALELDDGSAADFTPASDHLILYARLINVQAGDRVRLRIRGPSRLDATSLSPPYDRPKATTLVSSGGKRTVAAWPDGFYEGTAEVLREGAVVAERATRFEMRK